MWPIGTIADQVRTLQGQNLYGQRGTPGPDHARPPQWTFGNRRQGNGPPGGSSPVRGPPEGEDLDNEEEDELQTGKMSSHIDIFDGDQTKAKKFQIEFGLAQMTKPHHQNMRVPMQRVALALSYIKEEEVDEWSHEYVNQLANKVYNNEVDPSDEQLWDDFVLAFIYRFWDTGEEERAWAQLLTVEMKDNDLDGYIAKFESLLRKAERDRLEAANADIFKQGLKTWLFQMIMWRRPLPLTLDEWQWMVRDKFSANAIIKATLGGGRAKGKFSARQNYYATLNNVPKISEQKPRDPDAMDIDAMRTSKLSREEQDKLREECKCFNCKKKGHLAKDCQKKGSKNAEQKDKRPQSHKTKGEKSQRNNNEKLSTSKRGDPPSNEMDVVAAICWMTAERKTLAIEQLAGEGSLKHPITMARLRMIARRKDEMHIRRISAINMKIPFWSLSKQSKKTVLIDSGATENFLDRETRQKMGIGSHETVKPIMVYNIDRTENSQGNISHYCWLWIWYDERQKLQHFYIAALGKESIILGYPFFYAFNPTINWQKGALPGDLHIQTPRYTVNIDSEISSISRRKQSRRRATQKKGKQYICVGV